MSYCVFEPTYKVKEIRVGEKAQQGQELAAKADGLSLIPGTHIMEGEILFLQVGFFLFFFCTHIHKYM